MGVQAELADNAGRSRSGGDLSRSRNRVAFFHWHSTPPGRQPAFRGTRSAVYPRPVSKLYHENLVTIFRYGLN